MTATFPSVTFGLYNMTVKTASTPSATSTQTFVDITDLATGNVVWQSFATLEPNYWKLDGNYKLLADVENHLGWMSAVQSGSTRMFATPPVLTITFDTVYDVDGVALTFFRPGNEYCDNLKIQYYDAGDALIREQTYHPTSYDFSTGEVVTGLKKLVITFYSTNKPYRYMRLKSVDYGNIVKFEKENILAATITEQVDPVSVTLPFDVADIEIFSDDPNFSIVNPTGDYSGLQNRQPLDIYELIGGNELYMGRFYLDTWSNITYYRMQFHCIDGIGLLDKTPYDGGIWTSPITVGDLIEDMLGAINTPYYLDPALEAVEILGWIPATTYRAALQQIGFAIGAIITSSRSGLIQIKQSILAVDDTDVDGNLTAAEKSIDQKLTLKTLVTGVDLTTHDYVSNTTAVSLYNASLAIGTHKITFEKPAHTLSATGATIVESGANYAVLWVGAPGTVTLDGQGYTDTSQTMSQRLSGLDPAVKPNILVIKDGTLVTKTNGPAVLARVFNYYQQRYLQTVRLFASSLTVGDTIKVDAVYNTQVRCIIEKSTCDLTRGFVANLEATGVLL